jgi:hypothetical protein
VTANLEYFLLNKIGILNLQGCKTLTKMVESHGDAVIYENKEIEKIIQQYKPKKIVVYNNKDDSTYERDIVPFTEFIKKNNLTHYFDFHIFSWTGHIPEGKTHHHIQFPGNKKHLEILKAAL